jgi:hypothetical protein
MIAAAGAGPSPIPQKSLNVDSLTAAIQFCLRPDVVTATEKIAAKMKTESGVKAAVASFHANLPLGRLECDIIKSQPASWTYKGKDTSLKLSKVAAEILSNHLKVDFRKLRTLLLQSFTSEYATTFGAVSY